MTALDVGAVRARFPALASGAAFFDGPAGSQVPQSVIDAVAGYLRDSNANTHGAFATSRATDAMVDGARAAVARFLGAPDPAGVAFGPNMTTLTLSLSRALARTWEPGDEIVVTRLDHDANVWPWVLAARDAGATVRWLDFERDDCTLDTERLRALLSERTQLVAVGAASNAVGTINPVKRIAALAHEVEATVFVDAVHYAPHGPIDVADWGCDFLACSAYKFFGPHVGILWGRPELLRALPAYQVRPADADVPDRWQTGTQNLEGIAGTRAAIDYLESLGWDAIATHERALARQLLSGLRSIPDIRIWGIRHEDRLTERVPTFAITHARHTSESVARTLADRAIYVWSGNFYALEVTTALALEPDGLIRLGLLHYNTPDEIDRLLTTLREL